ncbi:MAG TPA: glycosyl transferase [Desulfotomaculum sp.]|nr:MAG: Glycosyl transferase family 2 [Desulfotomaculum sp. 46_80]HAG11286.1 glycosyl transferase [Desulfotomaculum sp.]HBY03566.1 glycosyl transferase [Desulfotomaculum sp.]
MPSGKTVEVLIPAYNEEERISDTVSAILDLPEINGVLVIDDGSADDTAIKARLAGANVISLPANSGKGEALNCGIKELTAEIIVFLDADLGSSAAEAKRLIDPVMNDIADMTIARFPKSKRKGGFGLVKGLAREGIRRHTGLVMESPLSGQRAMTRQVAEKTAPFAAGFGVEVSMTITAAKQGFRILEVPVNMRHNETGQNWKGFMHRGKQFWHVALVLAGIGRRKRGAEC